MRGIYTGLAIWNLLVLTAFAVVGTIQAVSGAFETRPYQVFALFSAFFCCLIHSLLVAHFIGSMKWIQQSGPTAGIEDTKPIRTIWVKSRAFKVLTFAMCAAVAAAILSGAAETGSAPAWVFLLVAYGSLALNAWTPVLARVEIDANRARMRDIEAKMEARIASGEVAKEEREVDLLPESGTAGGKVLLFLAANVWILYAYFKWVLRRNDESWWPYAVASIVLAVVGWGLLRNTTPRPTSTPSP